MQRLSNDTAVRGIFGTLSLLTLLYSYNAFIRMFLQVLRVAPNLVLKVQVGAKNWSMHLCYLSKV